MNSSTTESIEQLSIRLSQDGRAGAHLEASAVISSFQLRWVAQTCLHGRTNNSAATYCSASGPPTTAATATAAVIQTVDDHRSRRTHQCRDDDPSPSCRCVSGWLKSFASSSVCWPSTDPDIRRTELTAWSATNCRPGRAILM